MANVIVIELPQRIDGEFQRHMSVYSHGILVDHLTVPMDKVESVTTLVLHRLVDCTVYDKMEIKGANRL